MEYFKIWIVNILLTILSLSLYYPWAKVRNRRYFYANTTLEGRSFEYHATGSQLFVGYIIAIALFATFIVVQTLFPLVGQWFIFAVGLATPWIVWRSLKFAMQLTSFSNVRMAFSNPVGGAISNYLRLPLAAGVSMGIAGLALFIFFASYFGTASVQIRLTVVTACVLLWLCLVVLTYAFLIRRKSTYTIDGMRYGQAAFSSDLAFSGILKILLKTIGLMLLIMLLYGFLLTVLVVATGTTETLVKAITSFKGIEVPSKPALPLAAAVCFGTLLLIFSLVAYFFTRKRAYIFANTLLDRKIAFRSTLGARRYAWVTSTNALLVIFTLGLAIPWVRVRMARLLAENTLVDTSSGLNDYIAQQQVEQSSLGEQIGDAFDIDVGIDI